MAGNVIGTGNISKTQKEDSWAWVEIGEPFPDGPIKAKGAQNEYVALWYKHGSPVCGRAWNNGGVVECAFPYKGKMLTGKKDLGGQIQILSYDMTKESREAWQACGYVYEWVKWKDRRQDHLQLVRCGDSTVIMMPAADGNMYCGNINMSTETASIAYNNKAEEKNTGIGEMFTIVRNLKCPPPAIELPKIYDDTWMDLKEGDDFARCAKGILALGRPLKTPSGPQKSYVALWYKHGQPVMGRIYEGSNGKLAAQFSYDGYEYTKNIGSLQVLAYDPDTTGFQISWQPYSEAAKVGGKWRPVKVKDCAPCVITLKNGCEMLGRVQMSEEKAGAGNGSGKEEIFTGPQVKSFMVLCRDN